jgi:hypothetical protein
MEQRALKNVNNCLNTNIYSYLEISGGQSYNLYLYVVHFFNTSVNETFVATQDNCFPALVSNMRCSIGLMPWQRNALIKSEIIMLNLNEMIIQIK